MKTERTASKTSQSGSPGPSFTSPMRLLALISMISGLFAGVELQAADKYPPNRLTYQGFLVDANGMPLATNAPKNYDVIFGIWDDESAGAAPLWLELQTVTVDNGNFSALLGEGAPVGTNAHGALSSLFVGPSASDRYVELTVKGIGSSGEDVVLAPRLRLLASPYSFTARTAHSLVSDSGISLVTSSGNNSVIVQGTVTASNFVGGLNASNIVGTIPDSRLSTNVALKNAANTFSANQLFRGGGGAFSNAPTAPLQVAANGNISPEVNGLYVYNSVNAINNNAVLAARVGGPSAGDPLISLDVASEAGWSIGVDNSDANKLKFSSSWSTLDSAQVSIDTSGRMGIGTQSPGEKLDVNGNIHLGGGIWSSSANNSLIRFGDSYYVTIGETEGDDVMSLQATKFNFNSGTLYCKGATFNTFTLEAYLDINGAANVSQSRSDLPHSIIADYRIQAGTGFDVASDARIKKVLGTSDSAADLAALRGVQVVDYTFKDTLAQGNDRQKKVVAQQVEQVFPLAVNKGVGVVPDVFKSAKIEDGWVLLATDLKAGDRVQLITAKGTEIHEVTQASADRFQIAKMPDGKDVFVYGREVKDFRTVDYDALAMLNISATQELARQVDALQKGRGKLAELEERFSRFEELEKKLSRMGDLERELADLKKMIAHQAAPQQASPSVATEPTETTTQSPR